MNKNHELIIINKEIFQFLKINKSFNLNGNFKQQIEGF